MDLQWWIVTNKRLCIALIRARCWTGESSFYIGLTCNSAVNLVLVLFVPIWSSWLSVYFDAKTRFSYDTSWLSVSLDAKTRISVQNSWFSSVHVFVPNQQRHSIFLFNSWHDGRPWVLTCLSAWNTWSQAAPSRGVRCLHHRTVRVSVMWIKEITALQLLLLARGGCQRTPMHPHNNLVSWVVYIVARAV